LTKVTEQVSIGELTQETTYSYSLLDNLTQVNQGGQYRSYKYDSMGRLLYEKIPEQTPTINDGTGTYWTSAYGYSEFSSVKKKTDDLAKKERQRGVRLYKLIFQPYKRHKRQRGVTHQA